MCGIVGFLGEAPDKAKLIENMSDIIHHRGPDDAGYFIDKDISMGFRRLSIIDLDAGKQPIYNETNTYIYLITVFLLSVVSAIVIFAGVCK